MTERPTRCGFLAACSAAAAALGLTARAAPARPPIPGVLMPDDLKAIGVAKAELKQVGISVNSNGSGYTMPPIVNFSGGGCYMVKGRLVDAYGRELKPDDTAG